MIEYWLGMYARKFLNIVVRDHETRRYALHRIRLSKNIFYEATENATAQEVAKATKKKSGRWPSTLLNLRRLPRPEVYFSAQPALIGHSFDFDHFFSLLPARGEGCVMFTDHSGNASLYDVGMQSVVAMPQAKFPKADNSITLSITNKPYELLPPF